MIPNHSSKRREITAVCQLLDIRGDLFISLDIRLIMISDQTRVNPIFSDHLKSGTMPVTVSGHVILYALSAPNR